MTLTLAQKVPVIKRLFTKTLHLSNYLRKSGLCLRRIKNCQTFEKFCLKCRKGNIFQPDSFFSVLIPQDMFRGLEDAQLFAFSAKSFKKLHLLLILGIKHWVFHPSTIFLSFRMGSLTFNFRNKLDCSFRFVSRRKKT